ncbi:MAG: NblA/ycf18 family protein [Timaviella obliquedivisa GSE-PSE-MK23-08B]|jgi:hypothetical protein|nr:NblA/ycf18 family protein [Timaviella obliquedivisa GSE-PSE-MK23-08B]
MEQPVALSLEQQFNLRSLEEKSKHLPLEQIQRMLIETYTQMMLNDARYKAELKKQWRI